MSGKLPHFQMYIDGEFTEGSENQVMETINPATGEAWATFSCASKDDVERAVSAARRALTEGPWAEMNPSQRGQVLYKLSELVSEVAHDLGALETNDSGKLAKETRMQSGYVSDYYRYYAGLADKIQGATLPVDKPGIFAYTTPEPIGVVAAVVPWNAQMFLTATKVGPALAAGCTVVLKASELAPCAMFEFAKAIEKAGVPAGVVSIISGDAPNCSVPLTMHPDIDRLAFTGSPETAKHIVRNSAESFAVTSLELGGKSPMVVFEDADLDSAANGLIAGNFGASGQSCVACTRAIVHSSIKDKLIEKISATAEQIVIGDPLDDATQMGPLCTANQVMLIGETLEKAKAQGATVVFGGKKPDSHKDGNFFEPTLVDCPNMDIETLKVEMFGPVMSMVTFETEEEAIALANDTVFGLGSGIFTNDLARAHRVSSRIRAGICWVNTYRMISPIAPFGGVNQSGYGREAGMEAINDFVRSKTTWINTSDTPMANPFVMR